MSQPIHFAGEYRVSFSIDPEPNVASVGLFAGDFFPAVLLFGVNPSPHFVELKPLGSQVLERLILIDGANFASFR